MGLVWIWTNFRGGGCNFAQCQGDYNLPISLNNDAKIKLVFIKFLVDVSFALWWKLMVVATYKIIKNI